MRMIVYECNGKFALKHIQQDFKTLCGIMLYDEITEEFTKWANEHISTEHELPREKYCRKCFPSQEVAKDHEFVAKRNSSDCTYCHKGRLEGSHH